MASLEISASPIGFKWSQMGLQRRSSDKTLMTWVSVAGCVLMERTGLVTTPCGIPVLLEAELLHRSWNCLCLSQKLSVFIPYFTLWMWWELCDGHRKSRKWLEFSCLSQISHYWCNVKSRMKYGKFRLRSCTWVDHLDQWLAEHSCQNDAKSILFTAAHLWRNFPIKVSNVINLLPYYCW